MRKTKKSFPKPSHKIEAELLKAKRNKLELSAVELGKKINCSQTIISRIERGEFPESPTKAKMVLELFESEDNFRKRVSDRKKWLSEHFPTLKQRSEKYSLSETSTIQSFKTLNDIELRASIVSKIKKVMASFQDNSNDSSVTTYVDDSSVFDDLELIITEFYKWHEVNRKIVKSDGYHKTIDHGNKELIKLNKVSKKQLGLLNPSELQVRLKGCYTKQRLQKLKKSYAYSKGKFGNMFIREFVLQLYRMFKKRCKNKVEAVDLVFNVVKALNAQNKKAGFSKYAYFGKMLDEKKIEKSNRNGEEEHAFVRYLIDEAIKNNPKFLGGCRFPLGDFMYYPFVDYESVSPHKHRK